jgi:hypothetical protein
MCRSSFMLRIGFSFVSLNGFMMYLAEPWPPCSAFFFQRVKAQPILISLNAVKNHIYQRTKTLGQVYF